MLAPVFVAVPTGAPSRCVRPFARHIPTLMQNLLIEKEIIHLPVRGKDSAPVRLPFHPPGNAGVDSGGLSGHRQTRCPIMDSAT